MLGSYLVGAVALAAAIVPVAFAAVTVRDWLVPAWKGAPARLAEIVAGLALLFAVLHVLGSVGLFRRWAIVLGCVLTSVAVVMAIGGRTMSAADYADDPDAADDPEEVTAPSPTAESPPWSIYVVIGLITLITAHWFSRTLTTFDRGITDYDSIAYHLPHAARFVQTGWITDLHYNRPGWPDMLHPSDGELLHATGMAMFGRDFLSPFLNLGWGALMLLAGWCAGMRRGVAPLTLAAAAVILASPSMAAVGAASASTDVPSVSLVMVAAALLLYDHRSRGVVVLAGAAAGMALGTKLTVLVPVAVLTLALAGLLWRRRPALIAAWTLPLVLTGAFWFVRNLFRTGSPLPSIKVGVGPLAFPTGTFVELEQFGHSIAEYLGDRSVWREWYLPGLDDALGPGWPLFLGVAAIALVLSFVKGSAVVRALMVGAVASLVSHLVNPASGYGPPDEPFFFPINLRYFYVGVALPLVALPTLAWFRRRRPLGAAFVVVAAAMVVASQFDDQRAYKPWADSYRRSSVALAVLAVGAFVALYAYRRKLTRPLIAGLVAAAVVGGVGAGYFAERRYLDNRYTSNPVGRWAASTHDARIGTVGFDQHYSLYGRDLSNHVQYVGRTGPHGAWFDIDDCGEWKAALIAGRYRYVAVGIHDAAPQRYQDWIAAEPAARPMLQTESEAVYELTKPPDASTCPTEQ